MFCPLTLFSEPVDTKVLHCPLLQHCLALQYRQPCRAFLPLASTRVYCFCRPTLSNSLTYPSFYTSTTHTTAFLLSSIPFSSPPSYFIIYPPQLIVNLLPIYFTLFPLLLLPSSLSSFHYITPPSNSLPLPSPPLPFFTVWHPPGCNRGQSGVRQSHCQWRLRHPGSEEGLDKSYLSNMREAFRNSTNRIMLEDED